MFTKKLLLKTLLYIAVIVGFFFVAKHIGSAFYHLASAGVVVLVIEIAVGYLASAATITPVGTKASITVRKIMLIAAAVCVIASLVMGGIAGAVGALLGAAGGLIYHRSVL